jgi:hypothetical protein
MPSGDEIVLKLFSMPQCNICHKDAILAIRDNGGDTEDCCGSYLENAVVICYHCGEEEEIK